MGETKNEERAREFAERRALIMIRDNDLGAGRRSTLFKTFSHDDAEVGGGVLNSSRDDRALMRVRTPRGLTRISREACCRVIGIKMANGASIKGLTDFRLLSRAHAVSAASFRRFRGCEPPRRHMDAPAKWPGNALRDFIAPRNFLLHPSPEIFAWRIVVRLFKFERSGTVLQPRRDIEWMKLSRYASFENSRKIEERTNASIVVCPKLTRVDRMWIYHFPVWSSPTMKIASLLSFQAKFHRWIRLLRRLTITKIGYRYFHLRSKRRVCTCVGGASRGQYLFFGHFPRWMKFNCELSGEETR